MDLYRLEDRRDVCGTLTVKPRKYLGQSEWIHTQNETLTDNLEHVVMTFLKTFNFN